MKKMLLLGMTLAFACAAYAYPTFNGSTGYALFPTADVAAAGQLNAAVDFINTDDATLPVRANYGVMENLEVSANFTANDNQNGYGFGAKYLTPITLLGFNWAGGANVNLFEGTGTSGLDAYWVGSRALLEGDDAGIAVNGTVGLAGNFLKNATSYLTVFGGADATFANNINVALEVGSKGRNAEVPFSALVRYPFMENLTGQIGVTNNGSKNSDFFIGANYAFGLAGE